jgi:DNA-binding LacI/PurR family transcriptional regulator
MAASSQQDRDSRGLAPGGPRGRRRGQRLVPAGLGEAFAAELFRGSDSPDAIAAIAAIAAMSDELALGALRAAGRAGLAVPGAVAITGWDDTDAATPAGLTTVRQSLRDQGRRCARIALGHPRPDRQEPPGWEVVERTSTR